MDKTTQELLAERARIEGNPVNQTKPGSSMFKYTPAARRKLDKIDRSIAHNMRAARLARGEEVNDAGYSGRQSNRR